MNFKLVRYSTAVFLLVGLIFTSSSAFSYWREVTVERDVELVTIGEPVEVLIENLNENQELRQLVPYGYIDSSGDVDQITLEYNISISKELLNALNLDISVVDLQINGLEDYTHLVEIEILGGTDSASLELYNSTILVTLDVRLIEPIDLDEAIRDGLDIDLVNVEDSKAAYNAISGNDITFSLMFELSLKEEQQEIIDSLTTN